jgi:hypothetical protein
MLMRRLTGIALVCAALLAGACGVADRQSGSTIPPSPATDDVVLPAEPPDHATTDHPAADSDATTSAPTPPSDTFDAAPSERDDAGGESIGVIDEVTIVIIDPDDG